VSWRSYPSFNTAPSIAPLPNCDNWPSAKASRSNASITARDQVSIFIKINIGILSQSLLTRICFSARQPAALKNIICMYAGMTYGTTVRDLCIRFNPQALGINERKLVQFGVLEGLIRRIYKVRRYIIIPNAIWKMYLLQYPVTIAGDGSENGKNDAGNKVYTGLTSLDELCCQTGSSMTEFEEQLERDRSISMLWKWSSRKKFDLMTLVTELHKNSSHNRLLQTKNKTIETFSL
jgi:hypothetical protein